MASQDPNRPLLPGFNPFTLPARKRTEAGTSQQRDLRRQRQKTRIYLTFAHERWKKLKEEKKFNSDADMAIALMDW